MKLLHNVHCINNVTDEQCPNNTEHGVICISYQESIK